MNTPFRYDYVGSFLRPLELKEARADFEAGTITKEQLRDIENKCIEKLVAEIKEAGYQVITDGEYRRSWWHYDFFWGIQGIEKASSKKGLVFKGMETRAEYPKLIGKISGENHPFVEDFKFIQQFEDDNTVAKITFPSPSQFIKEFDREENIEKRNELYPVREELISDIAKAYQQIIHDLYQAGCRNIQIDDCSYTRLLNDSFQQDQKLFKKLAEEYLEVNNRALENLPEDLVINKHICRGNYRSHFFAEGGYEKIAPYIFEERINAFYLEFDDERSGNLEVLKNLKPNQKVVLGFITSKRPELEDKDFIIGRIKEAGQYVPLDRLYLSPQCGFSSTEEGNDLTFEDQWKKLGLVKEIAEEVWK